jgi:hypothetical protein
MPGWRPGRHGLLICFNPGLREEGPGSDPGPFLEERASCGAANLACRSVRSIGMLVEENGIGPGLRVTKGRGVGQDVKSATKPP